MGQAQRKHANLNGIDTSTLKKTIGEIQRNPELAQCEFRVRNHWLKGDANEAEAYDYYAACEEQHHSKKFKFQAGEPQLLGGHDQGANPVEFLLTGLSGCMTTTIAYYAALNGYEIEKMDSNFKGDLDLQGLLDLDPDVRPGYQKIHAHFKIKTNAPKEDLETYYPFSPVYDVVSRSVPIEVSIETY